jgi:hypothetical protein
MFARIITTGEGDREALLVPRIALVSGIRKPEVFVVRNGKAFLTPFIAGMELQKELEALNGLKVGESVVTSGQTELLNGSAVLIIGQKKGQTAP